MPTTGRATGNLPVELTSFVGRRREVGEVKGLLSESRLVMVTGIGGAGKTRLAVRIAAELESAFADGVWFVDLTPLQDHEPPTLEVQNPDVLAYLLGATLGLRDLGGEPLDRLVEELTDRAMLLVLDNCEHLLTATAALARALLVGCPELRILATSRDPLSMGGETVFPVPPLPAPEPDQWWCLAEMSRCEAVALFLARAQAAVSNFQLTAENHVAVGELCHRLDGLPLAIELAAARVRALTPQEILERLTDRFALLNQGNRAAPERQKTLRACIDWSYDLCGKPERMLWARLSTFAGTFELDAVEGICADDEVPEADLLDLVADLVDKSILVRNDRDDLNDPDHLLQSARYRMLETIRDYGLDKLVESGQDVTTRRRHRDWYLGLVDRAGAEWVSDRQRRWYARLGREHANVRVAAEFCLAEPGEAQAVIRMVAAVPAMYWWARVVSDDALRWLERALVTVTEPTVLRARALAHAGYLAIWHRDPETVTRLVDEGHALAERLGDRLGLAFAACARGTAANQHGDFAAAAEIFKSALPLVSDASEDESALALRLQLHLGLGAAALLQGDLDTSADAYQQVIDITTARGERVWRSYALCNRGMVAWRRGKMDDARRYVEECLRVARDYETDDRYAAICVEALAWIAACEEQHLRAAALLGAARKLLTERGMRVAEYRTLAADHEACERRVRQALGETEFAQALRHGSELPYRDVLAYSLEEGP